MTTPLGSASGTTATPTATSATAATAAAAVKSGESAMGPDAFMKLLVAQLKYQNPMAPADGQAYMTQMATFTQVEKLDQLVKAQADAVQWQQRVSAEGLVGRSVSSTTGGVTTSGTVTGVSYGASGPVLELSGGKKLASTAVDHVGTAVAATPDTPAATPAATPAPTPAVTPAASTGTTGTGTTGTAVPSSTTSSGSTTSTAATPAGTPSA